MDARSCHDHRPCRWMFALCASAAFLATPRSWSQEPAPTSLLAQALARTLQDGRPTVVIVISRTQPDTIAFAGGLQERHKQHLVETISLVVLEKEANPEAVDRLGVSTLPSTVVYGRSAAGKLEVIGHLARAEDPDRVVAWVKGLAGWPGTPQVASERHAEAAVDPAVARTDFASPQAYPSGQNQYQPPVPPPAQPPKMLPPVPTAPPMMPPAVGVPPVFSPPPLAPTVVSPPVAPVVFQPAAPTILVGPTPQPHIVFASSPNPTISYMSPVASAPPAASPPSLFMSPVANSPTPGFSPQPQPGFSPQPQPGFSPQPQPGFSPQPQPGFSPQPQPGFAPQAGQSPMLSAAILTAPNLLDRVLGAVGDHLAQRRNPRIQMGQAPAMAPMPTSGFAPMGQAPVGMDNYAWVPKKHGRAFIPIYGGQPSPYGGDSPYGGYPPYGAGNGPWPGGYGSGGGDYAPFGGGGEYAPPADYRPTPSPQAAPPSHHRSWLPWKN